MSAPLTAQEAALAELGAALREQGYAFTTITPASHALVAARPAPDEASLRDIFGWTRPFVAQRIAPRIRALMERADVIADAGAGRALSKVRFSTLDGELFCHSAYPTLAQDAVFFGPDTYRFVRFVRAALQGYAATGAPLLADLGCGSGAGGICAARHLPSATRLLLADISPRALGLARVNAALAGMPGARTVQGDLYAGLPRADIVLANPPYLVDREHRVYRDGGGALGYDLSLRIVREGLPRLADGGMLVLYTGVAMVEGGDPFLAAITPLLAASGCAWRYEEIDPDVFGEELAHGPYAAADRIAAVGLVIRKP